MVTREDLKRTVILGFLTDPMIEKLLPIVQLRAYHEREHIIRQGDVADTFYILKRGKILLEQQISDKITASLGSIKPGYSFGWSAMLEGEPYRSNAVASEISEVYAFPRESFLHILDNDHHMGYLVMQRLLRVIKTRLDQRTEQFIRAIIKHPDIKAVL